MTYFQRRGHYRTNRYGYTFFVRQHSVERDDWERSGVYNVWEGADAYTLINGKVSQGQERLGGAGARCWRLLVYDSGGWVPALSFAADGEVSVPIGQQHSQSRLRASAHGTLEDYVNGEVALLDPPGDEGGWIARPRPGTPRTALLNYPFLAPVEVDLRKDGDSVGVYAWSPSGRPVHGEVLAFEDPRENDDKAPTQLSFIGPGSQRTGRKTIYAWTPSSYAARTSSGAPVACLWQDDKHRLFRLDEKAYVGSGDDEFSYCLEPNAESETSERLSLSGREARQLVSPRGVPVFLGSPEVILWTGPTSTKVPDSGEVYWRPIGEKTWRDLRMQPLEQGEIEIVWRSSESRVARDRCRIVVLPSSLTLSRRGMQNGRAEFWLEDGGSWRLAPDHTGAYSSEVTDRGFFANWTGGQRRIIPVGLVSGNIRIGLETQFPLGDGALVGADGLVFKNGEAVTFSRLRGARAVADGRAKLVIEDTKARERGVYYQEITDEGSLWSFHDRIAALMEVSGDLDCQVRVGYAPNGPSILVKRYELDVRVLEGSVALAQPPKVQSGALSFRWRSLTDPSIDGRRMVGLLSVSDAMSCRHVKLPDDLEGPGVVFLCEGEEITSRCRLVSGRPLEGARLTPLQAAVVLKDIDKRKSAFREAYSAVENDGPGAQRDIEWLRQFLEANADFPATTFEVLVELGRRFRVLAHMIASSHDEAALERVWLLEPELPFLWVLIGTEDWREAFARQRRRTTNELLKIGWPQSKAETTAAEQVGSAIEMLVALDENLKAPLSAAELFKVEPVKQRTPKEIGQDRIRRLAGSEREGSGESCFMSDSQIRPELLELRAWYEDFSPEFWEGLQAPLVAALRASAKVKLMHLHRLRIRDAINDDPEHFSEAYAAAIHLLTDPAKSTKVR